MRQPGAVEGWRAVLMVVLRYGMGQWRRRMTLADGGSNKSTDFSGATP
jgi:hypothetical protein